MGFGYLLLGYLVTYVISITASSLGFGAVAFIIGAALMFWAFCSLCNFNTSFDPARWLTLPIFILGVFYLWQSSLGSTLSSVLEWVRFAVTLLFHFAMLYAIRVLALEVGLKKISSHALYNTLAVGIWGALYLLCNMPRMGEKVLPYLGFSMALFNLFYLISNVLLLLRCAKNICAEGDEEVAPKPSRFAWVNRISNSYNQTMDKLKQNSRADGDAFWRNHMEKKPKNNTQNQKHKKKKKK